MITAVVAVKVVPELKLISMTAWAVGLVASLVDIPTQDGRIKSILEATRDSTTTLADEEPAGFTRVSRTCVIGDVPESHMSPPLPQSEIQVFEVWKMTASGTARHILTVEEGKDGGKVRSGTDVIDRLTELEDPICPAALYPSCPSVVLPQHIVLEFEKTTQVCDLPPAIDTADKVACEKVIYGKLVISVVTVPLSIEVFNPS